MAFEIRILADVEDHLRVLTARQRAMVLDEVTGNCCTSQTWKLGTGSPCGPIPAPWELRIGDLRVYYDIEHDPTKRVSFRPGG